jgi:hypothetical protein
VVSLDVPEPGVLEIRPDGVMRDRTTGYDKRLRDMEGYRDAAAYEAALARQGWTNRPNPDHIGYRTDADEY